MLRHAACLAICLAYQLAAAASIDSICPNASEVLASTPFPLEAPESFALGSAEVEFTVETDGAVVDKVLASAVHETFANAALAAVGRFACLPQPSSRRLKLPIDWVRPTTITNVICPNYESVMRKLEFPFDAARRGVDRGEVIVDFVLRRDGTIPQFEVRLVSDPAFGLAALRALVKVQCQAPGHDIRVRVPFSFRLE